MRAHAPQNMRRKLPMRPDGLFGLCTSIAIVIGTASTAFGQTPEPEPQTRQTTIESAAAEKATDLCGQGSSAPVTGLPRIGIDNFGCVGPKYYRGGQPSGRDYGDLAALGIKAVVNLAGDDADPHEQAVVEASGMRYFQLPMTTHEPPTPARVAEFLGLVTDQRNQPVFVHCVGGRHRTGVMTAVYRMTQDRWTAAQAFEEMKRYKFGPEFLHREFKEFVYRYGAELTRGAPAQTVSAPSMTGGN
jgi:protein tyrosine/serine phosphatase